MPDQPTNAGEVLAKLREFCVLRKRRAERELYNLTPNGWLHGKTTGEVTAFKGAINKIDELEAAAKEKK